LEKRPVSLSNLGDVRSILKGGELKNVPRDRPFTPKLSDHLKERVFGIDKFDHALKIYLSTEKVGVNELAGREERTLLVDEACDGARDGSKGIIVHDRRDGAFLWLRIQKVMIKSQERWKNTDILFFATAGEVLRPFPGQHWHRP